MGNRRVDLVIVEGLSDKAYLYPLKKILSQNDNDAYVHVTFGDITTNISTNHKATIIKKLHDVVKEVNSENKFGLSSIRRIIHIVDIDGIYCSNDDIIEDKEASGVTYINNKLIAKNKNSIIKRNEDKKKILSILSTLSSGLSFKEGNEEIKIDYSTYFFSICADHVMVDRINLTDEEKEELSMDFADKYKDNLPGFIKILDSKSFVGANYKDSWNKINDSSVAFEARTNVNLLVE